MGELNLVNSLKQKMESIIDVIEHQNLLVNILKERRNSYEFNERVFESGWIKLGGKDYCQDRWKYDEDDNIITSDGKRWNGETYEEIN